MKIYIACTLLLITLTASAHEPNEAFFTLSQNDGLVEVEAEFPWTLRNALLAFDPSLEKSKNKSDFEKAFIEYLKSNLVLAGENGEIFNFIGFEALENNGHSHQNIYLLSFAGQDLLKVSNTLLFNIYDNQKNYNTLATASNEKTYVTAKDNPGFTVFTASKSIPIYSAFLMLIFPLGYFVVKHKRKDSGRAD